MARLASLLDGCGPLAERPISAQRAALVAVTAARTTTTPAPRQVFPRVGAEPAAAARGPPDRLRAHLMSLRGHIGADRVRRPAPGHPGLHLGGQHRVRFELPCAGPPRPAARVSLRCGRVVHSLGAAAAAQLATDRRRVPAQHHRDVQSGRSRRSRRLNPGALERAQPRCHMGHLHWRLLCRTTRHHDRSLATTGGVRRPTGLSVRRRVV